MGQTRKEEWEGYVASNVALSEMNEDGERHEVLHYSVRLENERGDRFITTASFNTEAEADALLVRVNHYLKLGLSPRGSNKWARHYPVYASPAYAEYGQAEEVLWEKKTAESESFR